MPVQTCPRCRRANPELAVYCYFDGFELRRRPTARRSACRRSSCSPRAGAAEPTTNSPRRARRNGRRRDLLQRGAIGQFFSSCGRADLVRSAQDANAQGAPDAALAAFLASLPGVRTQTPRLDISPRRVLLGNLLAGETRQLPVTITNAGQGSLQGTASITEGQDLVRLADGRAVFEVPVDAPRQQQLMLYLNTRGLPANQGHGAKLTVVTNGGVAEVPLRLELVSRPFPAAPFQGVKASASWLSGCATSPRRASRCSRAARCGAGSSSTAGPIRSPVPRSAAWRQCSSSSRRSAFPSRRHCSSRPPRCDCAANIPIAHVTS